MEMSDNIISLYESIQLELNQIKALQAEGSMRQYARSGTGPDAVYGCYTRVHGYLTRILFEISKSVHRKVEDQSKILEEQANMTKEQARKLEEQERKVEEQERKSKELEQHVQSAHPQSPLSRLSPALSARYNSAQAVELKRGICTPGTRVDVLAQMHQWASVSGSDAGSVYWLNGMAGTGKTTIAYSLCAELENKKQLAASFFCSRLLPECRNVNYIIPSIAYQLARRLPVFGAALVKVLERDPDIHTQLPSIQFASLISEPLVEVQASIPGNLVVVIDALDECESQESTKVVLSALLRAGDKLQLPIRFFISSRPEPDIRQQMQDRMNGRGYSQLILHELDTDTVQTDIEKYVRNALAPLDRISDDQIAKLVADAGVLFIYAATAVRYISDSGFSRNPYGRLQNVLEASGTGPKLKNKAIDELYTVILRAALEDKAIDETERGDILQILHTVVAAQEPLTVRALSGLLQLDNEDRVRASIRPLWSVLHVTGGNQLVTTLHASFPDYMLSHERATDYYCDRKLYDGILARLCLDCIATTTPRFNLCGLESSFVLDRDVDGLDQKVQKAVSPHLLYACRYWINHLATTYGTADLVLQVQNYISKHLLLWLEVMNLSQNTQMAIDVMRRTDEWATANTASPELKELAHDAWCFTTSFASNVASASTPHLYISILPFWPSSRPISRAYRHLFPRLSHVDGPAMDMRQLAVLATWSFPGGVFYAAFSPNGSRVVFASASQVTVVDAYSGRAITGPLDGHTQAIRSVKFSPDGTRIVSCSVDKSIRVWDAETGEQLLGPLLGHSKDVDSVQYSPDGTCIASGSWDGTIRVWDAASGEAKLVIEPPEECRSGIISIRYSPDGAHIAVGLCNGQLLIRDASTGALTLGPLMGHTKSVISVDYSPDGTRVVSGSFDKTIRVWSAAKGDLVLGPLIGHTGWIRSVKYSPNGRHIVSGSDDRTVRAWDAQTGDTILGPLEGHHSSITSVCYSPDSTRLVSCGGEKTVYVWDARSQQKALPAADGCTKGVESVAYSSDGTRIVSGSGNDVHIWNASTGDLILGPLTAHTDTVTSVDYSPAGDQFASGSGDCTICIWDAQPGSGLPLFAFSSLIMKINKKKKNAQTRAVLLGPLTGHTDWVTSVAYSPRGTSLASGSYDRTVRVWDTRSGDMILGPLRGHAYMVTTVRYSPTGTYIASGSWDWTILVWDARSGDMVLGPLTGHTDSILSIGFSPDGTRLASSSDDSSIHVWDTQTGQVVLGPLKGRAERGQVRYSPTGAHIYSCQDNRIWVLDAYTGNVALGPLTGHQRDITSIDISPDGTRLISGSIDNSIRVWDVQPQPGSDLSTLIHLTWEINDDGWVVDSSDSSRLLVWVPHDLRASLMHPRSISLISRKGKLWLNLENACIGTRWGECYAPPV
ncbi:Vegetative incompatibility protein HET-E-1 OS=Podospora anserina GN=HET-E1 PE=4 SV=1 [Rhizoctonia solani AG-1 IB]|uniref:Vegetative incompatibility protein HET-E-1 n=1 Tax=Thanatephorus cucumeris (strain AG1-IB / isolate 7/3/14) TaxID=1108050 RepID=A0A0B7FMW8_THACB|nr:Vegetative incompatibility protein HET-E-1 OS=Podospora anserina GN=HET-E1 PE=4 SV=1 [Rhizoctonia solani AG-1 IB]